METTCSSASPPPPPLSLLDLELLHHYVTSTAFTLHTDPVMKGLWRTNAPQIGFKHDFVMRGMLALSALHVARFKPEKRDFYIAYASQQHNAGLRTATAVLSQITDDNCAAAYLFSAFTLFFILASPRKGGDFIVLDQRGISDRLRFFRGTSFIIDSSEATLIGGTIGPMFQIGKRREAAQHHIIATEHYDPLSELQENIIKFGSDPAITTIYTEAVRLLRISFMHLPGSEISDVFQWVFRVSDEYLQLLRKQTQESLAIMAYFCVVLKRLDNQWWMEGWSSHLIAKVWNLLDEDHRLVFYQFRALIDGNSW